MISNKKLLQIKAMQKKLTLLFDNTNNGEWLDEIRLSTNEAALFLGITPNALRIKVHRGQINAEKLDQKLRFTISHILSSFKKLEDAYGNS